MPILCCTPCSCTTGLCVCQIQSGRLQYEGIVGFAWPTALTFFTSAITEWMPPPQLCQGAVSRLLSDSLCSHVELIHTLCFSARPVPIPPQEKVPRRERQTMETEDKLKWSTPGRYLVVFHSHGHLRVISEFEQIKLIYVLFDLCNEFHHITIFI